MRPFASFLSPTYLYVEAVVGEGVCLSKEMGLPEYLSSVYSVYDTVLTSAQNDVTPPITTFAQENSQEYVCRFTHEWVKIWYAFIIFFSHKIQFHQN